MFKDNKFGLIFPTRTGKAIGGASERQMLDAIGGSSASFRKRFRTDLAGNVTRLDTKNGMPQFTTTPAKKDVNVEILSGVTRGGTYVSEALHSYRPTAQARGFATVKTDKEQPTEFNDEVKLKVDLAPRLSGQEQGQPLTGPYPVVTVAPAMDSQYRHVTGSMYSGRMAKLVQLLMAYGRVPSPHQPQKDVDKTNYDVTMGYFKRLFSLDDPALDEVRAVTQVLYDYRWPRCHGVVTATDGKLWLVEISVVNGVIAMPLPMKTVDRYIGHAQEALREAGALFGGLPSGGTFPADQDLAVAIATGKVIVLAGAADMAPFFDKNPYSQALGWSFRDNDFEELGEAHNTCWHVDGDGKKQACHYKLAIEIQKTKLTSELAPNEPIAGGSATLSLIEEKWMALYAGLPIPFQFYDPQQEPEYIGTWPTITADNDVFFTEAGTTGFPVHVCHRDNQLEVVRVRWTGGDTIKIGAYCEPNFPWAVGSTYRQAQLWIWSSNPDGSPGAPGNGKSVYTVSEASTDLMTYGGKWPAGARDCYAMMETGYTAVVLRTTISAFGFEPVPPDAPFGEFNQDVTGMGSPDAPDPITADSERQLAETNSMAWETVTKRPIKVQVATSRNIVAAPDLDYDTYDTGMRNLWKGAEGIYFPRFYARSSVLGPNPHVAFSTDLVYAPAGFGIRSFEGELLSGESSDAEPNYSFIGYI